MEKLLLKFMGTSFLSFTPEIQRNAGSIQNGNIRADITSDGIITYTRISDNMILLQGNSDQENNLQNSSHYTTLGMDNPLDIIQSIVPPGLTPLRLPFKHIQMKGTHFRN